MPPGDPILAYSVDDARARMETIKWVKSAIVERHCPARSFYGLLAFAPLGAAFGPSAMTLALLGAVVVNVLASLVGGGRLVSGQRASLSLLTAALVTALTHMQLPDGPASAAQVLALTALAVICSGLLQSVSACSSSADIVKYTPHPVRVGVTSGVGLLLLETALPVITGHGFGTSLRSAFESMQAGALAVGLSALLVTAIAARMKSRIPPVLIGLLAASLLHFGLAAALPSLRLGELIGAPLLMAHGLSLDALAALRPGLLQQPVLMLLGSYALTAAVLCRLDTLLVVSVIDGRLRRARDANRELWGQGLANCVAGAITALPLSPSMPRTLALVLPHPDRRQIVLSYALALLAILLLVPQLVGWVPISAIGGVLLLQGAQMVAPAFRGGLQALRQFGPHGRHGRHGGRGGRNGTVADAPAGQKRGDWFVELAVALGAVAFGLGPAVLIGASCAVLLFVRSNMRDVVRREWTGQTRRSLKARPSAPVQALAAEGGRIALLELEGALFFGTAFQFERCDPAAFRREIVRRAAPSAEHRVAGPYAVRARVARVRAHEQQHRAARADRRPQGRGAKAETAPSATAWTEASRLLARSGMAARAAPAATAAMAAMAAMGPELPQRLQPASEGRRHHLRACRAQDAADRADRHPARPVRREQAAGGASA